MEKHMNTTQKLQENKNISKSGAQGSLVQGRRGMGVFLFG
jgi:hypothetical protein